jgi:hypothetical protein
MSPNGVRLAVEPMTEVGEDDADARERMGM